MDEKSDTLKWVTHLTNYSITDKKIQEHLLHKVDRQVIFTKKL